MGSRGGDDHGRCDRRGQAHLRVRSQSLAERGRSGPLGGRGRAARSMSYHRDVATPAWAVCGYAPGASRGLHSSGPRLGAVTRFLDALNCAFRGFPHRECAGPLPRLRRRAPCRQSEAKCSGTPETGPFPWSSPLRTQSVLQGDENARPRLGRRRAPRHTAVDARMWMCRLNSVNRTP
jgi:hypothetical protein